MAGRPPGPPHSQLVTARAPRRGKRREPVRKGTFGQFCDVDSYTPYFIQRKSWANRPGSSETRLRGRALQQARAELFKRNPYCVTCQKKGISRLATERDHVIPLFEGGTDDPSNTAGLCNPCHKEKTQQESNRARGITTKPRMKSGCDISGFPLSRDHPLEPVKVE